ncbi:MAG TPA: GGDEF domain-containing protein [Xanthobacteraceae bacterium]|nr:GGDEF domain-containing protein [Xanthobacteraceae bacterium]
MPDFSRSPFIVDLPTLCLVSVFLTATAGVLLVLAWVQNRREPALALWGLGYLLGSAGVGLLGIRGAFPGNDSQMVSSALICCAYGVMWAGARTFEARKAPLGCAFAGAALWLALYQWPAFAETQPARLAALSAILASYVLLAAREVWRGRDPELISRWPTLALLIIHAGFVLVRIPLAGALPFAVMGGAQRLFVSIMALEALFATFALAFLRVSMAKERVELQQRKAALTDALTGIANRRDFFERGERLLADALGERRPVALLLFDLDRFKDVNDGAGHHAGDQVLRGLTQLVAPTLAANDLFARMGGDEFACLLPGASMTRALQIAETVRHGFDALRVEGLACHPTVSVGLAMASETAEPLASLLANADRALYRAKAEGRNRVAPAPLVLIERASSAAAPPLAPASPASMARLRPTLSSI